MNRSRFLCTAILFASASAISQAATLTGRVVGPGGVPAVNVDLDLDDSATGLPIATIADHTNAQGVFSFAVPNGTYNIAFIPPPALRLADKKIFNVAVPGNTNLGDITLETGYLVTGHVVDYLGNPIFDVDQDVEDSFTGDRVPTHADHTDVNGNFSFLAPAGTRDILVLPAKTTRAVARVLVGVVIAGDTNVGTIPCAQGFLLSGRVTGSGGASASAIDLNAYDETNGALIATVGDNTDVNGNYSILVPAGTISVDAEPPIGLGLAHSRTTGVHVVGDGMLNIALQATPVAVGISRSGRLARVGTTFAYSVRVRNTTPSVQRVTARIFVEEPVSGVQGNVVGPRQGRLVANFGPVTTPLGLRIPGSTPQRFIGRPLNLRIVVNDATSSLLLDSDVTQFTIR
ncbi:MAG: carboxypeptidase regulatory-like domain-containing protein [Planctomycetes bacterium]|nr:carboxypeptidase regulatory-like domain-containing protein [Planctomycetota bacterium]MBI3847063.1 carboxypeptidase regulatory-like domain-containing protein [Planctomycetota bacterium]